MEPGDAVRVVGYRGVAFRFLGHPQTCVNEGDWEPEWESDIHHARVRMVGDDREMIVDIDDCRPLSEDGFCSECGQIGCMHGRHG
jgi:hypothetical protein